MAAAVGCLSGCLVSSSSHTEYSGSYVSHTELSKLAKGESTEQQVLAMFGPPTEKTVEADESVIWQYRWEEVKERDAAVFLVSELSRGVTGTTLWVDGGYHIMAL